MSSSTARAPNAQRLLKELPNAQLSEAVDGRDREQIAHVNCREGDLFTPSYPFALRPAEIGVFQSHRKIWRKLVDENIDMAIITEDDLQVDPVIFPKALALIDKYATPDHYIRLPVKQREKPAQTVDHDDGLHLCLPRIIGLQCICQVVGKRAAKRLLEMSETIDRPVDTFLQMHWHTGQPLHTLLGVNNTEVAPQIGGSTIQTKSPPGSKFGRELKRAVYRAQLMLHPQKP